MSAKSVKNSPGERRVKGNKFTTKSGQTIKVQRTLGQRMKARKDAKAVRKAERLKDLPKSRVKRFFYHLHPKRVAKYWFSRDGLIMGMKILGIMIIVGFVFMIGIFAYFRKDLPNLNDIAGTNIGGSIRYYDRTGQKLLWEDYDAVKRIPVKDNEISPYIKDATVAIEDRDFYTHGGFNVKGITRAAWNNAFGGSTQGGSTITQQLVKLTNPGFATDRTVSRKIKELILAVEMEREYSKKDILNGYLNAAPYGGIEYGVEAASRNYFGKSAKDLTLDEAAFLASIPKSPRFYSSYSPDFEKQAFIGRQHYILGIMAETGKITKKQLEEAKKIDTIAKVKGRPSSKYNGILAPYFVFAAKDQLESKFGEKTYNRGGWKVTTTLDLDKQNVAEDEVNKEVAKMRARPGYFVFDTAAFVAEDVKTGQVVALVGNSTFDAGRDGGMLNFAHTEKIPPGSSFKPYDYLSLIEHSTNFGAGSVLYDTQGAIDGYPCTNKALPKNGGNCLYDYDFRYPGPLNLRYALGGSRNVPAVKAMLIAGVDKTIGTANKLGLVREDGSGGYKCYADEALKTEGPCYSSSAIGDGAFLQLDRHVHSYATISRNGNKIPQTYILKIEDSQNKEVDVWKPSNGEQVVRQDSAYIVADMMSDPNASYFSNKPHRYKGWNFALKTGTTNDSKDGLLMGFSTNYAAGVWVGYHTRRLASHSFMETMTQPIWQGWMDRVHSNIPPETRAKPADLQTLPSYIVRTHVGLGSNEGVQNGKDIFPSWYKAPTAKPGKKSTIDIISNKLATDCTPGRARKESFESDASQFSGDKFVNTGTVSQETDDVHKCDDQKPTITDFSVKPDPGNPGHYIMTASIVGGTHALTSDKYKGTVTFSIEGQVLPGASFQIDNNGDVTYEYTSTFDGQKEVTATIVDSVLYDTTATVDKIFQKPDEPGNMPINYSPGSNRRRKRSVPL